MGTEVSWLTGAPLSRALRLAWMTLLGPGPVGSPRIYAQFEPSIPGGKAPGPHAVRAYLRRLIRSGRHRQEGHAPQAPSHLRHAPPQGRRGTPASGSRWRDPAHASSPNAPTHTHPRGDREIPLALNLSVADVARPYLRGLPARLLPLYRSPGESRPGCAPRARRRRRAW